MSMQLESGEMEEEKVEEVVEEILKDVPLIEMSEFTDKVKESVEKLVGALSKGVHEGKLCLEIDTILALIRVAVVGTPQKANYGEIAPISTKPLIELTE